MRVVIIGGLAHSLVNFRGELLRAMVAGGHEVLTLAPDDDPAVRRTLAAMGVGFESIPLERSGLDPRRDVRAFWAILSAIRRFRPAALLAYTAKPIIYGVVAARIGKVDSRAALVTGAGSILDGEAGRVAALILRFLYGVALRQATLVLFQNPDDEVGFRRLGLTGRTQRTLQVAGSGVDLARFGAMPLPSDGPITFLMVARLLRNKGVREYVAAARSLRQSGAEARFLLLGGLDPNPTAIPAAELEAWRAEGTVEYLGTTADVRPVITLAHVFVLPSYSEGTPRSTLEAMAMARPVVTTDAPGCRETVVPGRNGLVVPPRDAAALARAMRSLLDTPSLLAAMGAESRRIAEERFDVHKVNRVILEAMGLARPPEGEAA